MNKKIAVLVVCAFLAGLLVRGFFATGDSAKVANSPSQSPALIAWEDFMARMTALGTRILQDDLGSRATLGTFPNQDDRDRAEGFRQLAHMVVEGLRWEFDHADSEFPSLMVTNNDTTGWGGPNVDNKYLRARIDGRSSYRLIGNLSGVREIAVQTNLGDMHMGQIGTSETLDKSGLTIDGEGNFSLTISPQEAEGDWLALDADHTILSIRIYFADWETDSDAELYLVRIGSEGRSPQPLSEAIVAQRLTNAAAWVEGSVINWNRWMKASLLLYTENEAAKPKSVPGGSTALVYGGIPFNLRQDEALIIEVAPPPADYWSFQTYTHGWFDAGDYANRITSLNMEQVYRSPDGKVWIVVAHDDPGVPNWIDTEGRQKAVVTHRWLNAQTDAEPIARVVKFAELNEYLPIDMPTTPPQQRRRQIAVRQKHVQHRFHN